jgi:hypothetical protein
MRRSCPIRCRGGWFYAALGATLLSVRPVCAAPPAAAEAIPIDGPAFAAEMLGIDSEGTAHFSVAGEPRSLPLADLVLWGAPADPRPGDVRVLLADGGAIVAETLTLDEDSLGIDSDLVGRLEFPLAQIAGILFRSPIDRLARDTLADRLTAPAGDSDRLLLDNGDELAGTLRDLGETQLTFATAAGDVKIERDRVVGLAFNPRLIDRPAASAAGVLVGLADGSLLRVERLATEDARADLQLSADQVAYAPRESITVVQPVGGRATYLSDLKPAGYVHVPYLQLPWEYRADRNVLGGGLRGGGVAYQKGLGMHSTARITYKLDRPWRRFQAEACIDDAAGPGGSVVFRVFVDKQERFTSPVVRGGDARIPIDIDITGGKTISLIVDFAERGDMLDHADWLNARLVE